MSEVHHHHFEIIEGKGTCDCGKAWEEPGREMASEVAAVQWGMSLDEAAAAFDRLAQALDLSPQAELRWRIQERANGRDPGPSVNWRGL